VFFLLFTAVFGKIVNVKRTKAGRTSSPEAVAFQLLFLGNCDQFLSIPNIAISSHIDACLPLDPNTFLALNDLSAHVLCTNIGGGRSQVDFLEIYLTYGVPLTVPFAISFVPTIPFTAVTGGVTYARRPDCTTKNDYCSSTVYVYSCNENIVQTRRGWVISGDEVFIIPNQFTAVGCGAQALNCCPYLKAGFCPITQPQTTLNWVEEHHKEQQQHEEEHEEEHHEPEKHRPEQHKPEQHKPEQHKPEQHRPEQHKPEQHQPEQHQQNEQHEQFNEEEDDGADWNEKQKKNVPPQKKSAEKPIVQHKAPIQKQNAPIYHDDEESEDKK